MMRGYLIFYGSLSVFNHIFTDVGFSQFLCTRQHLSKSLKKIFKFSWNLGKLAKILTKVL